MGESAAGSVPGQAEKISTVMCESDRLALELELERCNAFLQWVACDEERQVDELNELVSREDALLDEGQRLQEVFNTADRLSELVEELNSRVRRVVLHEQALKAALVKPASECETGNGEWKTLSHYFPARRTRPCTIAIGPTKDSKRHSSDSARSKEETEGNIDTGLEQELARLKARAERADSVASTLRCHLERSRIETKRAKKSAADQKLEMEQEMQKLQQQLRSSARQLKEAERRTRGAQEEAKNGKTYGRMLQQQIDELHAEVETLGTHLRERDEQFGKLQQLQQLENQDKEKKLRQEMLRREEMLREKEAHLRAASSMAVSEAENYAKRLYEECQRELLEQLEMQETRLEKEAIRSAEQSELELSVKLQKAEVRAQAAEEIAAQKEARLSETIAALRERDLVQQQQLGQHQQSIARLTAIIHTMHEQLLVQHKDAAQALLSAANSAGEFLFPTPDEGQCREIVSGGACYSERAADRLVCLSTPLDEASGV